jgi:hypothetical protein
MLCSVLHEPLQFVQSLLYELQQLQLTEVINLKASIAFALFFVTIRMYKSLCLRYMNVQEPKVRTGVCMLDDSPLLFNICALKLSAMSLLQGQRTVACQLSCP